MARSAPGHRHAEGLAFHEDYGERYAVENVRPGDGNEALSRDGPEIIQGGLGSLALQHDTRLHLRRIAVERGVGDSHSLRVEQCVVDGWNCITNLRLGEALVCANFDRNATVTAGEYVDYVERFSGGITCECDPRVGAINDLRSCEGLRICLADS